jgi:glycosyltransferase involved in cell wall biosynthesis
MKKISIITPCLNESASVSNFYEEIVSCFESITDYDFELIFIDDGSTDDTAAIMSSIAKKDNRCKVVINSRNFGVYRSSFNALRYANGVATIPLMPVDLQDPPEMIPQFIDHWEKGFLVVAGARFEREEGFIMKKIRHAYYKFASKVADYELPKYVGEFQLIDASIVDELRKIDDYYPYTRGLIASITNKRVTLNYVWQKRTIGKSNMNLWKLIDQGLNGIVSVSTAPLRILTLISFFTSIVGILFGAVQVLAHFTYAKSITPPGTSTMIILIGFFAAVNSIILGVIAEYIGAIHSQIRGRSRVTVLQTINIERLSQ